MANPISIIGKNFNQLNTYNPSTSDNKTDGMSVLCFGNNDRPINVENCTIDGEVARWGGKHSSTYDSVYKNCVFKNGTARAFDMVRGGHIKFFGCNFVNDGTRPIVKSPYTTLSEHCDIGIKGGVHDVTFTDCVFNDILLGDYTIYDQQDRPKTRRFTFVGCKNQTGGPIIVRGRYVDGDTLSFDKTPNRTFVWPSLLTSAYWLYNRKFGDKRKPDGWDVILPQERN